jgi:hypothetical protein
MRLAKEEWEQEQAGAAGAGIPTDQDRTAPFAGA